MPVLREVVAAFVLRFLDHGSKKAEKTLQNLQRTANGLQNAMGNIFSATLISAPIVALVKMASDAQEQLNVIDVAFGDNAGEVLTWADTWGAAVGRSSYTLRKMAAEMGVLVRPMVKSSELSAKMSMDLAQLAVDISSLRNIPESIALGRLLSGMSGETEAIKRLGIVMTQVNLEQYALQKGYGKSEKAMNMAEKTVLRYNYIMENATVFMGDAERTQYMLANSTRALRDLLKDVGTDLGFFLIPAFTDLVRWLREIIPPLQRSTRAFTKWNKDTNLAKGAVIALASAIGMMLLPVMLKMVGFALAFAVFALIMDEVYTTLAGGRSVLGDFNSALEEMVEYIDKMEDSDEVFSTWELIMATAVKTADDLAKGIGAVFTTIWYSFAKESTEAFEVSDAMADGFLEKLKDIDRYVISHRWNAFMEGIADSVAAGMIKLERYIRSMGRVFRAFYILGTQWVNRAVDAMLVILNRLKGKVKEAILHDWIELQKWLPESWVKGLKSAGGAIGRAFSGGGVGVAGGGVTQKLMGVGSIPASLSGATTTILNNNASTQMSFTIQPPAGSSPEDIASAVREEAEKLMSEQNDDLVRAFVPAAQGG